MRNRIFNLGFAMALLVVMAACAPSRTIDTTPEVGPSTGLSVPYSLPRGLLSVTVKQVADKPSVITFNKLEMVPDPQARYVANFNRRALRSDTFNIKLDRGLLSVSKNTTTDATPEFVEKLTSAVTENLKTAREDANNTGAPKGLRTDTVLLDPFRHSGTVADGVTVAFKDLNGKHIEHRSGYQSCPQGSLCFPLLMTVKAIVTATNGGTVARSELTTVIPDPNRVAAIDINRYACVKAQTDITFDQGILVDYSLDKPSELVGCLSIPLDIVSAIISAPVDAITGRTKRLEAEKGLLAAQQALLTQQAALITAQSEAAAASQAAPPSN